ncbi:MAG: isoprenoid biosynthesis glyoxalase ElbB [Pseudobdellovibrionaceae bacterium]
MSKKIAVILAGCGFKDGSEITEAVSVLIALSQKKATVYCFAPEENKIAINHLTFEPYEHSRSLLEEAARICRGQIQGLNSLVAADFDGLVIPGGSGALKNLSTWSTDGHRCQLNSDLQKVLKDFYQQSKPIAAVCIAPVMVAKALGAHKIEITIGNDPELAAEVAKTGAVPIDCPVDDHVSDREHKILSTPAYMYDASPAEVFKGIQGMVHELVEWC